MNLYKDLPSGNDDLTTINVVIDIPRGSSNKYEYHEEEGYFTLDRVLHSQMFYPFDYGFIPQTIGDDDDGIDVILLTTYPTFPGCVVKARIIGYLDCHDEGGGDAKIVAVPVSKVDPRWDEYQSIDDIPKHTKKELLLHFKEIKLLEEAKYPKVVIEGFKSKEEAVEVIQKGKAAYDKKDR